MERSDSYHLTLWAGIFPIVLLGIALIRLWIRQRIFLRCLKHLTALLKDSRKANAVIYRLQDEEIIAFSKLSKAEIVHYVDEKNSQSLRWHLIDLAYFQRPRNDR